MAQIEQSDKGGKKKKGAQKKMSIHVDFTPMVDMNMLLITFFMLCTTMIKSQTLQIQLPSNNKEIKEDQKNQASVNEAITLILDTEHDANGEPVKDENGNTVHNVYYYEGFAKNPVTGELADLKLEHFIGNKNKQAQGIRKVIRDNHKEAMAQYDKLKADYKAKKIDANKFNEEAKRIATDPELHHPVVIVKPGPNTTYEGLIYAIDELNLNQVRRYSIQSPDATDTLLLKNYGTQNNVEVIRPDVRKK